MTSVENTRVTHGRMVMVAGDDGMAEVRVSRAINMSLVSQNSGIVMPIREVGVESSWGFPRESMKSIKD